MTSKPKSSVPSYFCLGVVQSTSPSVGFIAVFIVSLRPHSTNLQPVGPNMIPEFGRSGYFANGINKIFLVVADVAVLSKIS